MTEVKRTPQQMVSRDVRAEIEVQRRDLGVDQQFGAFTLGSTVVAR